MNVISVTPSFVFSNGKAMDFYKHCKIDLRIQIMQDSDIIEVRRSEGALCINEHINAYL